VIARYANADVERISAVTSGVKEIREAIERARQNRNAGRRTILFVDEVHRFNKSQQDAFLPHIEDGTIFFIGATTENPSFELNSALLSRARLPAQIADHRGYRKGSHSGDGRQSARLRRAGYRSA
jgi:putative ATPase